MAIALGLIRLGSVFNLVECSAKSDLSNAVTTVFIWIFPASRDFSRKFPGSFAVEYC